MISTKRLSFGASDGLLDSHVAAAGKDGSNNGAAGAMFNARLPSERALWLNVNWRDLFRPDALHASRICCHSGIGPLGAAMTAT